MLELDAVDAVVAGRHGDPFSVLGMHTDEDGRRWLRSFQPGAAQVEAWTADGSRQLAVLSERHADGFFEGPYPPTHRPTTGCRCAGPTARRARWTIPTVSRRCSATWTCG